jgi:tetratricopeptide (TPR) repeat protein
MVRLASVWVAALLLCAGCDKLKAAVGADDSTPREQGKLHLKKGLEFEQAGDDDAALQELELASRSLANDPEAAGAMGRIYAKKGRDAEAAMSLKRAIELDGRDPSLRKLLADVYLRQGQSAEAARVLGGQGDSTDDVEAQVKLVRMLIHTGKGTDALSRAEKLVAAHPESASALSAHAEALLATGSPDRAAELLDAAVKRSPEDVDVRLARARFLSQRGMHEKALSELERGNAGQSGRSDIIFARSHELALLQRYPEASAALETFSHEHPSDPAAQAALAWLKLQTGDTDGARAAAEQVLSRLPHDAEALYVRARCFEAQGEWTRAIGGYRDVLENEAGHTETLQHIWKAYEHEGQVNDAMSALETLLMTGEAGNPEKLELARLYSETGFNSARGIRLVEELSRGGSSNATTLSAIKKKLQVNAAKEHRGGGGGGGHSGPVMIRGGHR